MYRRLAGLLGMTSDQIRTRVTQQKDIIGRFSPIVVKRNIGDELALVLEERHRELPGVHVVSQAIRDYVDGTLTANVLGYMGPIDAKQIETLSKDKQRDYKGFDWIGQTNLENVFEFELRGFPGSRRSEVDASRA